MTHKSTLTPARVQLVADGIHARVLRAVDYLRVSTEDQKKGYGVASQGKKTRSYIASKSWHHAGTYIDEGVSGSLEADKRPDLRKLMAAAHRHEFDVVVVKEGRAIGRTGRAFWRWVWALEDIGIFVAIADGDIDNTTKDGRSEMRSQADYAEREWETIRARTQGGAQEKALETREEGAPHIGGPPPFGYRVVGKGEKGSYLVVDETEATVIRRVHAWMVNDGLNLRQCAAKLNASEETRTRRGKLWSYANIRDRIMSRAVLDGAIIFRGKNAKKDALGNPVFGESVTIQLPRILTEQEADEMRRTTRKFVKRSGPKSGCFPLTGRVISLCGATLTGHTREGKRRYYRCSGKLVPVPGGRACDCKPGYVDAEALEVPVWLEVVKTLRDPARLEELASEWLGMTSGNSAASADRIAELDRQIEAQQQAISAVMAVAAKEAIKKGEEEPDDYIQGATKALTEELAQLQGLRNEAAAWLAEQEDAERRAEDLKSLSRMAREDLEQWTLEEQAGFIKLLDLKVILKGPPPSMRKGGAHCTVRDWYKTAQRDVPAAPLTNEQWEKVAPLLTNGRPSSLRRTIDGLMYKARTGENWRAVEAACGCAQTTANQYFKQWSTDGTWAQIDATLTGVSRVPLPVPVLTPPMRIVGNIDPRVMLLPGEQSRTGS